MTAIEPQLGLGGVDAKDVEPRSLAVKDVIGEEGADKGVLEVQEMATQRTDSVLAPLIENAMLNSIGISFLRTNIVAFNKLREKYPDWIPDFSGENFEQINMDGVNLSRAILYKTSFVLASMKNSNLQGANLSYAQISSAHLTDSNLRNADFSNADLSDSFLHGADIRGAKMATADIDTGYLAAISGEDGQRIKVLDLLGIIYDSETTLPEISDPGVERTTLHIAGEDVLRGSLFGF